MSNNNIPPHESVRRSISFDGPTPPTNTTSNVVLSPTRALELPPSSESVSTAVCGSLEVDVGQMHNLTPQQQTVHSNNTIHSVSPGVRTPGGAPAEREGAKNPPTLKTTSLDNDDDEPQITCTVITIETSMQRPVESLGDPVISPTTRILVKQVPVLHIFGYTEDYSTCCVHIHGALPYFLVPCYTTNMSPEDFAGQLETAARRGGGTGGAPLVRPGTPVIHLVEVVMGLPFYGYHGTKRPFFKVYLYQPTLVSKLATLLGSTSEVGGRRWQPYEAHIPFAFQCMADMNLSGMGVLPMAGGTFRSNSALPDGLYIPPTSDSRNDASNSNDNTHLRDECDDDNDGGAGPPGPPRPPREAYTRLFIPSRVFDPISGTVMTVPRMMANFTRSTDDSRPREALSAVELDTSVDYILQGRERRMGGPPVPGENLSVVRKSLSKILCDTLHYTKAGAADVLKEAILDRFAEDRRVVGGSVEMAQKAAPLVPHMHDLATSYCNNRISQLQSQGSPFGGRSLDLPVAMTPSAETSSILQEWFCDASNASLTNLLRRKEQRAAEQQRRELLAGSSESGLLQGDLSPLSQMFPTLGTSATGSSEGDDNGEEGAFDFTVCPTFELLDFMRDGDAVEDSEPKLTPLVNDDSDGGEEEEEEEGGHENDADDANVNDGAPPPTMDTIHDTSSSSSPPRANPRKIQFDDEDVDNNVAPQAVRGTHIKGDKRPREEGYDGPLATNGTANADVEEDDEDMLLFPSSRARKETTVTTEPSLLASLDGFESTIGGRRLRLCVGGMEGGGMSLFHQEVPNPPMNDATITTTVAEDEEYNDAHRLGRGDDEDASISDVDSDGVPLHRPSLSADVDDVLVEEGALCTQYGAATQRWLAAEDDGGGAVTMSMLLGESIRPLGEGGVGAVSSSAPILTAITPRSKKVRRPKFRMSPSQPLNTQQRSCISMLKVLSIDVIAMPPACGKVVHAATSPLLAVGLAYTLSTSDTIEYKQYCVWPDYSPETSPYHHTSSPSSNTKVFKTERQLFTALIKEVRAADPDVVMSWDVDKYGLGYLVERGRLSSRIDLLEAMGRMRPDGFVGDDVEGYSSLGGGSGSGGEFKRVSWGVGSMRRDAARSEPPPLQRREGVVTIKIPGRIVIPLRKCAKSELKQKSYTFQAVYQTLFSRPCPYVQDDVLAAMYASGVSGATLENLNKRVVVPTTNVKGELGVLKDEIKDDPDGEADSSKTAPTRTHSASTCYFMKARTPLALHCLQVLVVGTLRIAKAMDLYVRTSEMAQLYGILFFEVLSRGSQFKVESFLQRFAKPRNFVLVSPSRQQVMLANQQEGIPLVMEPYSALYTDPVVVLDFRSLYPSVVIAYNLCYSTCLGKVNRNSRVQIGSLRNYRINDDFLSDALSNDGIAFAPNSCMFVKRSHRDGVLPAMLESILQTRFQVQKVIKGANERGEEDLARVLDAQQLALKMLANVTYGYTAATFSGRMPCTDLADSIVLLGRQTLERAIRTIQGNAAWNAKIVYGDTDSLFIQLPGRTRMQAFDVAEEMVRAVNAANPDPVTLKFEKVYHPCFMVVKKRYVGYAYEHRGQTVPKFDAKGIETVRRDQCEATSKVCEELIRALFDSVVKGGKHVVSPPSAHSTNNAPSTTTTNTTNTTTLRLPIAQPVSTATTPVMLDVDDDDDVADVDDEDCNAGNESRLVTGVRGRGAGVAVPSLSWKAVTVKLKRYFYEQANKIQRGDAHPSDYIIRREVKLGTYAKESSLPPAARVAVQRIEADAGDCPAYGDRVPYVVLCPTTGDQLKDMVADPFTLLRRNLHAALQSHLHNKRRSNSNTTSLVIKMASGEDAPHDADDGSATIKAEGADDGDFLTRVGVRCLQPLSPDGGISVLTALYPNNNNKSISSSSSPSSPAYFLLNGDHYLRKHIIPSLNRLFHMVGVDFMRWYDTMPKAASNNEGSLLFHKFFETATGNNSGNGDVPIKKDPLQTPTTSTTTTSTLDQYYSSTRCVVCHGDGSTHSRTLQREQKQRQQAAKQKVIQAAASSAGVVDVDDSSSSDVEGCDSLVAQPKPTNNIINATTTTSNEANPFAAGVRLSRRMGVHPLVRKPSIEIAEVEDFSQLPSSSSSAPVGVPPKSKTATKSSSSSLSPLVPICASCLSPDGRGAALFNITTRRHYLDRYYHRLLARCHSCMGCNQGDVVLSRAERAENILASHAEEDAESVSARRQYQAAKRLSKPLPFPYNSSNPSSLSAAAPSLPNGDPVCVGDANIADLEDLCLSIDCPTTFEKQRIRALRQHIGIIEGFLESDPMVEEALRRKEADGKVTIDTVGGGVRGQDANSAFHRSAASILSSSSACTVRGTLLHHSTTTATTAPAPHSAIRGGTSSRGRGGTRGGGRGGRGASSAPSSSSRRPPQTGKRNADDDDVVVLD